MRLLKWRGWDTWRWPGERTPSHPRSGTSSGQQRVKGSGTARPGGERSRLPPLPPRAMVSLTRGAGGACDWLRADGRRADWLLGDQGPGPRGRVRPRTFKWEDPHRHPQIRGCAADLPGPRTGGGELGARAQRHQGRFRAPSRSNEAPPLRAAPRPEAPGAVGRPSRLQPWGRRRWRSSAWCCVWWAGWA